MAFPTIPTVAAGRVLFTLNTAGGATKTFPNLSSLTKNSGDLLIAIAVIYDGNSTNAEFSSWGASFTEFADFAGTATMGIGCAYKWSTGSETGTFTVTTADTSTNDSVLMLLSIPGVHDTSAPEAGGFSTALPPDSGSFNPSWAAEDILWIAVGGSGETATTGSFTGIGGAPTNYGDLAQSGITADVVGGVEAAVSFRQLNADSEDVGAWSVDTSNARATSLVIAVRPAAATSVSLTAATETDAAQALSVTKSIRKTISTATETDTPQALSVTKTIFKSVSPATETDSAQALSIAGPILKTLTAAIETDAAQALNVDKAKMGLTAATETDAAQALTFTKAIYKSVGAATETAAVQGLNVDKAKSLSPVTETGTALTLTQAKLKNLIAAAETNAAIALQVGGVQRITLTPTTETSTAVALVVFVGDIGEPVLGPTRVVVGNQRNRVVLPRPNNAVTNILGNRVVTGESQNQVEVP